MRTSRTARAVARWPPPTRRTVSRCAACATTSLSRHATCGLAPPPPSRAKSASRRSSRRGASTGRRSIPLGALSGIAVIVVVIGASVLSGGFLSGRRATGHGRQRAADRASCPSCAGSPAPRRWRSVPVRSGGSGRRRTAASPTARPRSTRSVRPTASPTANPSTTATRSRSTSRSGRSRSRSRRSRTRPSSSGPMPPAAIRSSSCPSRRRTRPRRPSRRRRPRPTATPSLDPRADRDAGGLRDRPSASSEPSESASDRAERHAARSHRQPRSSLGRAIRRTDAGSDPDPTPNRRMSANLAIISGVKVVGQSAAYSPDGAWFAFTARPSDGSDGPDIYVWRVGDQLAQRGHERPRQRLRIVGRRPAARQPATAHDGEPAAVVLHRSGQRRRDAPSTASVWRPIVDPDEHWAVTWDGTVDGRRRTARPRSPARARSSCAASPTTAASTPTGARGGRRQGAVRRVRRPLGRDRLVARGLGGRRERSVDRAAQPSPARSGDRRARSARTARRAI